MMRITEVVKHLLIINIVVFLICSIAISSDWFDADALFALHYPTSELFRPYQFITHFFMHDDVMHIFFNMFMLVMFGSAIEATWGEKRFLIYYFICAMGAVGLHLGVYAFFELEPLEQALQLFIENPSTGNMYAFYEQMPGIDMEAIKGILLERANYIEQGSPEGISFATQEMQSLIESMNNTHIVGASGAISGILLAFAMTFPNVELMLLFLPVPIKAKYFIPILMVIELFMGVQRFSWDNTAHFAHLGGALMGFILVSFWKQRGVLR